jgi:hypothetical protein
MALLHLAITAFDLPHWGPERRRRYARLAVLGGYHGPLGGKRTPLCYSPATSLARCNSPYIDHVLQANRGTDLDFLFGASGHEPPSHNH